MPKRNPAEFKRSQTLKLNSIEAIVLGNVLSMVDLSTFHYESVRSLDRLVQMTVDDARIAQSLEDSASKRADRLDERARDAVHTFLAKAREAASLGWRQTCTVN